MPCKELLISLIDRSEEKPSCLKRPPTVEGGRSRAGVGRGRLAPRGSAPPCRAPRPDDACTAEGGFLPPRARPRSGGRVFAPSPTLLGPFAPQRVAAAHRCDVAEGFEASCCLPLAMTVRGETGGNVFILASPFSGCSDLWASLLGGSELWVYGILAGCMLPSCMSPTCM
jgi:hypothetical protein